MHVVRLVLESFAGEVGVRNLKAVAVNAGKNLRGRKNRKRAARSGVLVMMMLAGEEIC
jgi:hypothetical protein